ncbi:4Fe-4S dicluster domain-containing protein [Halodesulfovibrio sp.]|jgi:formate dehydrogenase iron-sulfur subunit|uniref:4Fe-4S dicluster domain-containing protein n=1 Tax=Halodesulfovibrio sp. TaxID=1912772 RepID=UPI0025FEEED9|nr:4Fe-4S dicluster domain-containing protein [Halodesulfovibrio sp.]MCT4535587.1 formate dehydrogenase [Halodesulfovibrio sp.]
MSKAFLIDTTRCTACRGCQIACKEWHELPANKTKQVGTHQNPPDLNVNNYKLVRFSEHLDGETITWNFFPDQCRHCVEPPCQGASDTVEEGAIIKDEATGAVIFTEKMKQFSDEDLQYVRESCPYDIPRWDAKTKRPGKCDMCIDRIQEGKLPACVHACPTGGMNFGDREEMLALAQTRLAKVKKEHPKAMLVDPEDVSVIYLLAEAPERYHTHVVAQAPVPTSRRQLFASLRTSVTSVSKS